MKAVRKASGEATADRPIRILIADDHVTVLEGMAAIISRQDDMRVVAAAANGREAVEQWRSERPDICLLDLRMPQLDGVGTIAEIRAIDPQARLIILTTFDTDADLERALQAGARGYLLKDAPREELLRCIRQVHAGGTFIPPELVAKLAQGLVREPLTLRETQVLELLADGASNRDIAGRLFITEATVKSHLRNVFMKLDVISRTEAVLEASRRGLVRI